MSKPKKQAPSSSSSSSSSTSKSAPTQSQSNSATQDAILDGELDSALIEELLEADRGLGAARPLLDLLQSAGEASNTARYSFDPEGVEAMGRVATKSALGLEGLLGAAEVALDRAERDALKPRIAWDNDEFQLLEIGVGMVEEELVTEASAAVVWILDAEEGTEIELHDIAWSKGLEVASDQAVADTLRMTGVAEGDLESTQQAIAAEADATDHGLFALALAAQLEADDGAMGFSAAEHAALVAGLEAVGAQEKAIALHDAQAKALDGLPAPAPLAFGELSPTNDVTAQELGDAPALQHVVTGPAHTNDSIDTYLDAAKLIGAAAPAQSTTAGASEVTDPEPEWSAESYGAAGPGMAGVQLQTQDTDGADTLQRAATAGFQNGSFAAEAGLLDTHNEVVDDGTEKSTVGLYGAYRDGKFAARLEAGGEVTRKGEGSETTESAKFIFGLDDDSMTVGRNAGRSYKRDDGLEVAGEVAGSVDVDMSGVKSVSVAGSGGVSKTDAIDGSKTGFSGQAGGTLHTEDTREDFDTTGNATKKSGWDFNFGVNGDVAGASLGLGGTYENTSTSTYTQERGGDVKVDEMDRSGWGGNASATNPIMSLQGSRSTIDIHGRNIRFYGTREGRAAYEYYEDKGRLPEGGGYEVTETDGSVWTGTSRFGVLGTSVTQQSLRSDTTTRDQAGNVLNEQSVGSSTLGAKVPLLSNMSHTHGLVGTQMGTEGEQFFTGYSVIDDTKAADAHEGLIDATGADRDLDMVDVLKAHDWEEGWNNAFDVVSGDADKLDTSSGKWAVTSRFSQAQMDVFTARVKRGNFAGGMDDDLRPALIAAKGDADAERMALADFVADHGDRALDVMRREINLGSEENVDVFVELEGDEFLTGVAGQLEHERRLAELEARIRDPHADKRAVLAELTEALAAEAEKKTLLGRSSNRYIELPYDLRLAEIKRADERIEELDTALDMAVGFAPADSDFGVYGGAQLRGARVLRERKKEAWEARQTYRQHVWVHAGGGADVALTFGHGPQSVRGEHDDSITHYAAYVTADSFGDLGHEALARADQLQIDLLEEEILDDHSYDAYKIGFSDALDAYEEAMAWFNDAGAIFEGQSVGVSPRLLKGYDKTPENIMGI